MITLKKNTPVVITDIRYRMSLSLIRSLGKKGIKVIGVESNLTSKEASLGSYSKYLTNCIYVSDSQKDEEGFIRDLINYSLKSNTKPVLIPVGIYSTIAISKYKIDLQPYYSFIVPSINCINIANDTYKLLKIANSTNIPAPKTTTLSNNETIIELSKRLKYPVVIKYREGELLKLPPQKRYKIIKDSNSFFKVFTYMHNIQAYPLVQEYITGDGYGVSAVFDKYSNPISIFCHKRLREYPVSGGPSCLCESYWNDSMVCYAIKLLKKLNWQGVAMVEFKGYPNGEIKLMEINPRIWGSFPLTVISGADFPNDIYNCSLDNNKPIDNLSYPKYKVGKKLRYILQDLLSFKGYLLLSKNKLQFILYYIIDILNPSISDGVFSITDFKVSLHYFKIAFKKYKK